MEDDNATDIVKWLFHDGTTTDLSSELQMMVDDQLVPCSARLKGNLLAFRTLEAAVVPLLFVCEKLKVEKADDEAKAFVIKYGDQHQLYIETDSEKAKELWMLKIAMASHNVVRAELDAVSHQYSVNSSVATTPSSTSNPYSYFLNDPIVKDISFWINTSGGTPSRKVICTEEMYESKICMMVPLEYMKLCLKWATELCNLCKSKQWRSGTQVVTEAAANCVRHLNSHLELYHQAIEYLDNYHGPSFRPSKDKYSMSTGSVATNLHVQVFKISDMDSVVSCPFITIGATAAIPLRFANGGLYRQREQLLSSLDKNGYDHTNIARFATRRNVLLKAKKTIGSLSRKIDNDWKIGPFGSVDKIGLEILASVKQLHETIMDMIASFPLINNLFNTVNNDETVDEDNRPSLSNQLDALEMSMISLNSKMAVIDTIDENQAGREYFQKSARTALNSTLDTLLHVVEGLLNSQILGFVNGLRTPADSQNYFHMQLREDFVTSQVITIISTALLTNLSQFPEDVIARWDLIPPLITYFSFLSCHAHEKGAMEDIFDVWTSLPSQIQFRFIAATSSISQVCVPQISGVRGDLDVSLPLNPALMKKLGPNLQEGNPFKVRACFWNLGINHEATFAQSMGSIVLEEEINKTALAEVDKYVNKALGLFAADPSFPTQQVSDKLCELVNAVTECASRKNVAIFYRVMELSQTLNAARIIGCKSGKDRTSMAVTLEEGQFVKEHCCVSGDQLLQIIESLRRNGVRLENCRKNIGKSLYSFSPFQMHFLPKELRPPNGTFGHNVMS